MILQTISIFSFFYGVIMRCNLQQDVQKDKLNKHMYMCTMPWQRKLN